MAWKWKTKHEQNVRPDCVAWCESMDCDDCDAPELREGSRHYNPPAPESQLIRDLEDLLGITKEEEI
jgi:hypothetical protein